MRRTGQLFGLGRKVAPFALALIGIGLAGCGHMALPRHVHFVVKVQVRYGQSMCKPVLSVDYLDFGLSPTDHNDLWLQKLDAFLQPEPLRQPVGSF